MVAGGSYLDFYLEKQVEDLVMKNCINFILCSGSEKREAMAAAVVGETS
jgi:hypothetical protein